jgi:hypothetical protein
MVSFRRQMYYLPNNSDPLLLTMKPHRILRAKWSNIRVNEHFDHSVIKIKVNSFFPPNFAPRTNLTTVHVIHREVDVCTEHHCIIQ